jgi:ADP-heptose:LPS heptosyltransferase
MPNILISPFSKKLRNGKRNPKDYPYWKEVIEGLKDYHIIQIGVEGEEQLVEDFRKNLGLKDIGKLLKDCIFISVDSFLPHLAHKVGVKGIVLWGQGNPRIFGHPEHINLLKDEKYLRPGIEQFWIWEMCEYKEEAFVSAEEVIREVHNFSPLTK